MEASHPDAATADVSSSSALRDFGEADENQIIHKSKKGIARSARASWLPSLPAHDASQLPFASSRTVALPPRDPACALACLRACEPACAPAGGQQQQQRDLASTRVDRTRMQQWPPQS